MAFGLPVAVAVALVGAGTAEAMVPNDGGQGPTRDQAQPQAPTQAQAPDAGKGQAGGRRLFIGQGNVGAWNDFTSSTGAKPDGGSVYYGVDKSNFGGSSGEGPHRAFADALTQAGADVEVGVSWKDSPPGWGGNDNDKVAASQRATRDIANGVYDQNFTALTDYISAHQGSTFHLRLDYEVSSAVHCANGSDCTSYKNAFRHLVELIDSRTGGTNVRYVYHPVRGEFDKLYPGDDVVDEVGISIFNQDLCQTFWSQGAANWNGEQDTTARTCSGYADKLVNGNRNAVPHGYPADLNLLRMMWWAQQHGKPMIVAESGVQRMSQQLDDQGRQSAQDYRAFMERMGTLLSYRGPLPNGVVDGRQTAFVGDGYDLSGVIQTVTYINIDWRYGFDGQVMPDQPFGFGDQDGWYVNSLVSANPDGKAALCEMLSSQGFASRCA
jgi:hypothetical protein